MSGLDPVEQVEDAEPGVGGEESPAQIRWTVRVQRAGGFADAAMLEHALRRAPGVLEAHGNAWTRELSVLVTGEEALEEVRRVLRGLGVRWRARAGEDSGGTAAGERWQGSPALLAGLPLLLVWVLHLLVGAPAGGTLYCALLACLLLAGGPMVRRAWWGIRLRRLLPAHLHVLLMLIGACGGAMEVFLGHAPELVSTAAGLIWLLRIGHELQERRGQVAAAGPAGFAPDSHQPPVLQQGAHEALRILAPALILAALASVTVWMLLPEPVMQALGSAARVLPGQPAGLGDWRAGVMSAMAVLAGAGLGFWGVLAWPRLYRARPVARARGWMFDGVGMIETLWETRIAVFQRRGVMTQDAPLLEEVVCAEGQSQEGVIKTAARAEGGSTHSIAALVRQRAFLTSPEALQEWQETPGRGVTAVTAEGERLTAGNALHCVSLGVETSTAGHDLYRIACEGRSAVLVTQGNALLGVLKVWEALRPESVRTVNQLRRLGIRSFLVTGEPEENAATVAEQLGVEGFRAGVTPARLPEVLARIGRETIGKVALVTRPGEGGGSGNLVIWVGGQTDGTGEDAGTVVRVARLGEVVELLQFSRRVRRDLFVLVAVGAVYLAILVPLAFLGLAPPLLALVLGVLMEWAPVCIGRGGNAFPK